MRLTRHLFFLILVGFALLPVACRRHAADQPGAPQGVHWDRASGVLSLRRGKRVSTMRFVRVKAGTFRMGGTDRPQTILVEGPRRTVRIRKSFWLAATEVTRDQWRAFSGEPGSADHPALPMTRVSWSQVQSFIKHISQLSGTSFRLPTETEWEYACRAGSKTPWSRRGDSSQLAQFGWYQSNSGGHLQPVATRKPNSFGLFDMHGNAVEWTQDSSRTGDRVLRGGFVLSTADEAACACRYQYPAAYGYQFAGFRLAAD